MNSHKTAIKRNKLSAPVQFLINNNLITRNKSILDFGCGRGDDVRLLKVNGFDITGFDPYYFPIILNKRFDIVLCNYVLNVVPNKERKLILNKIKQICKLSFISVRRDITKHIKTKIGTEQFNVKLSLPIIKENSSFCIYELKDESILF